jgi:iron complex transport system substrate-binding protein
MEVTTMLGHVPVPAEVEKLARVCVDCGMHVHRELGPGFKEVIYERAFCLELDSRGVRFETEKPILVRYKSWEIPGQKVDLLVAGVVLVEIKAVPKLKQIHTHQILSYLKTLDLRLGLLMNFKQRLLRDGLKRVVR